MAQTFRLRARAVLFGRVSNNLVLWLGLSLMALTVFLAAMGLSHLSSSNNHFVQDVRSQIMIRR